MSYDHSNKPKGATHIVADLYGMNDAKRRANEACLYRKQEDGIWYGFHHDVWHEISVPEPQRYQMLPTQWTGEGLPPVGTICEFRVEKDDWRQCEVIAYKDEYAVCWIHCNKILASVGHAIRPIRTPEQIAAEEREFEIIEIERVAMSGDTCKTMAEALYDAGYRKQVKP